MKYSKRDALRQTATSFNSLTLQYTRLERKIRSAIPCLFLLLFPAVVQGQAFVFSENFDDQDISGWTFYNQDGQVEISPFPNGNPWALVAFNHPPSHPLNSPLIGSCSHFQDSQAQADRWLVSPAIILPGTNHPITLTFRDVAGSLTINAHYEVLISTLGTNLEDFDLLTMQEIPVQQIGHRSIDLSAYAGKTINLAWRNTSTGNTWVFLDDILIQEQTATSINNTPNTTPAVHIYPNPANDILNIQVQHNKPIEAITIYDISGKIIYSNQSLMEQSFKVDTRSFKDGNYCLRVRSMGTHYYKQFTVLKQ